jgi:hypothetical protein
MIIAEQVQHPVQDQQANFSCRRVTFGAPIAPGCRDGDHNITEKALKFSVGKTGTKSSDCGTAVRFNVRCSNVLALAPRKRKHVGGLRLSPIHGIKLADPSIIYEAEIEILAPELQDLLDVANVVSQD